jgi:hypothetical protein
VHAATGNHLSDSASPGIVAALERLDTALDSGEFATTLTTVQGRPPYLSVTSRHARIGDDIWADHRAYYWSWGEWIAPTSDPQAAARMISMVLRTRPQPGRD